MSSIKTGFNWRDGQYIIKTMQRSFPTLEEAQRFAEGKDVKDIYRYKGKYRVEWQKVKKEWG